ncbi:hypothetical protein [Runella slithyformis]|uniref:Holin n=1 Tax=Runella slithyformis (strain ATCC 29530 / DSM 19594 / LMG 11500 / NCIMB 11436 / LSU 4) TaxID=761193 RepID=A0A7U4E4V2_RUNSL|nr:hypothetical protein [Runella slithyformis]AEI47679.1 hypothetical protein Runsl_1252 [Runella slithyformis DSM 19594]
MKTTFLKYLNPLFEYVQFNMKLTTILIVGILTALKQFIIRYIFDDTEYLISFVILSFIYILSGAVKAHVKGEFRIHLFFGKIILKVVSYIIFIGGISTFVKMQVKGHAVDWASSVDSYLYITAAANVFFNTIKNVIIINPGLLPEKVEKWFQEGAEAGTLTKPNL